MSEERNYTVVGKVEIGTDEYRDLIEEAMEMKAKYGEKASESWERYSEIEKLKKKVKELTSYKEYVEDKCLDSYRLWKIEKQEKECEE